MYFTCTDPEFLKLRLPRGGGGMWGPRPFFSVNLLFHFYKFEFSGWVGSDSRTLSRSAHALI